jgi:hypothetical protein
MRRQLFGDQREREAEDQLIEILTLQQTRLAAAALRGTRDSRQASLARGAVLRVLADGANGLLAWHREQVTAAAAAGWAPTPAEPLAQRAAAAAADACPLFEDVGFAASGALDYSDLLAGVTQLSGTDGDELYAGVLRGLVAAGDAIFEACATDAPTASAALQLRSTWEELRAEALALELAIPPPAPAAMPAAVAPAPAAPVVSPVEMAPAMELAAEPPVPDRPATAALTETGVTHEVAVPEPGPDLLEPAGAGWAVAANGLAEDALAPVALQPGARAPLSRSTDAAAGWDGAGGTVAERLLRFAEHEPPAGTLDETLLAAGRLTVSRSPESSPAAHPAEEPVPSAPPVDIVPAARRGGFYPAGAPAVFNIAARFGRIELVVLEQWQ